MAGIKAMTESDTAKPFRFMYISGAAAERDQSKAPAWLYGEYAKMRVRAVSLFQDRLRRLTVTGRDGKHGLCLRQGAS
jgi:hypothetical protein